MSPALSFQSFLASNGGKYVRKITQFPHDDGIIYATTNFEIGATDLLHYHDRTHLSFVVSGGVLDKRTHSEAEITAGDLMFFYQGEPHQSIYKRFPATSVNLELKSCFFESNLTDENRLKSALENNPLAKFTMLKIYKELLTQDDFSERSIEMLVLSLIKDKNYPEKISPVWTNKLQEILDDKWNEPVSLKDLSNAVGLHPVTISKLFPKYFSCTFGEYVRRLRIEKSLGMLKNSSVSLTEIAHECGFYDQSHFTRVFKNLTGFLPRAYVKL